MLRTADVQLNLDIIPFEPQRGVLLELATEFLETDRVNGILLDGSFARGEGRPDSDLDLYLLLRNDRQQVDYPARLTRRGVQIDLAQHDREMIEHRIRERPMRVYRHLLGAILVDRDGGLEQIAHFAREFMNGFRTPKEQTEGLLPTFENLYKKMRAASTSGDERLIGWSASWSGWALVEGLFAINDRPLPPAVLLPRFLPQLTKPSDIATRLKDWFTGDTHTRHASALDLVEFVLEELRSR